MPYIDPEYYIPTFLSWLPRLRFGIPVRLFHCCCKPGLLYIFKIKRNFNLRILIDTASFCRYFMIRSTWNTAKTMLLHGNIILIKKKSLEMHCHSFLLPLNVYSKFVSLSQTPVEIETFWLTDCFGVFSPCRQYFGHVKAGRILIKKLKWNSLHESANISVVYVQFFKIILKIL